MTAKINLAPEIYQSSQKIKARKKLVTTIGISVSAAAVGLVVLGIIVVIGQTAGIAVLNSQIKDKQNQVSENVDVVNAATAQQHLDTLRQLTATQAHFSNFFEVLQSFAPQGVAASKISIAADNNIEMTANARTFDLVTKFAKSLQESNTTVGKNASPTNKPYFTDVQLGAVSSDTSGISFKLTTSMSTEVTNGN